MACHEEVGCVETFCSVRPLALWEGYVVNMDGDGRCDRLAYAGGRLKSNWYVEGGRSRLICSGFDRVRTRQC